MQGADYVCVENKISSGTGWQTETLKNEPRFDIQDLSFVLCAGSANSEYLVAVASAIIAYLKPYLQCSLLVLTHIKYGTLHDKDVITPSELKSTITLH